MDEKTINTPTENEQNTTSTFSHCHCDNNCCCHSENKDNHYQCEKAKSIEDLEKEKAIIENKLIEMSDKYIRAMAEMENIKKRARADIESGAKAQMIKLATAFFPVIDSIEIAYKNTQSEADKSGLELVLKNAEEALKTMGIEKIKTIDEIFNPKYHQAISMIENSGKEPNTIISEMITGYKLGDTVLRSSMVSVAK